MSSTRQLPQFKSDEEEADFWDRFDTTQIPGRGRRNRIGVQTRNSGREHLHSVW